MEQLNCLGEACPLPVIKTKKALRECDEVEILVDNKIATENLSKMATQLNYQVDVEEISSNEYRVVIRKDGAESPQQTVGAPSEATSQPVSGYTVVIDSDVMGSCSDGNVELGQNLMKSFVSSLLEQDILPNEVILYNGGVKLAVDGSGIDEDLKSLEDKGAAIFSCGLCANYYGITEDIHVGSITNMYAIVSMLREQPNLVKP